MVDNFDMNCISATLSDISVQLDKITDMLIDVQKRLVRLEIKSKPPQLIGPIDKWADPIWKQHRSDVITCNHNSFKDMPEEKKKQFKELSKGLIDSGRYLSEGEIYG